MAGADRGIGRKHGDFHAKVQQKDYIKLDLRTKIRGARTREGDNGMKQSINEWLTALLKDGALSTSEVTARAKLAGYKRKELRVARLMLNIETISVGGTAWFWKLPDPHMLKLAELREKGRKPCP